MAAIVASASGDTTIVVALAGKKIRVFNYVLSASAVVNAKWKSGSTDLTGLLYLGITGGLVCNDNRGGWFDTAAGEDLVLNLSGAVPVGGHFKWAYMDA